MDHSQFIKSVEDTGLIGRGDLRLFTDEVIQWWLQDNTWVEDSTSCCKWCQHLEEIGSGFSEEQCRLNVAGGGCCYRETLKTVFIPFLRNALRGRYPSPVDLRRVIHHRGPIWDGFSDMTLVGIILHELGVTYMRTASEAYRQREAASAERPTEKPEA